MILHLNHPVRSRTGLKPMPSKKNSLNLALEQGKLKTRPITEIEQDQAEAIRWAEEVARHFPVKVRRGRPPKDEAGGPSRSVTVRFPAAEARLVLSSAERHGLTLSEFVRAAACSAASPKARPETMSRGPKPAPGRTRTAPRFGLERKGGSR